MQRGVNGIPYEPCRRVGNIVQERARVKRQLDDVVYLLEAATLPELAAKLEESPRRESVAGRYPDVLLVQPTQNVPDPSAVVGVAGEVGTILPDQPIPGRCLDVIDRPGYRR